MRPSQIDEQPPLDNVKEFVILVVFVPMVFTFNDAKAHHGPIQVARCRSLTPG